MSKAALAHLWFVTIHPLDDGNGRVARALADMLLARSEKTAQRFYSMSAQIRRERADYYETLKRTQTSTLDVTRWMLWFFGCLGTAIDGAQEMLEAVLTKVRFRKSARTVPLNERQRKMLDHLLEGFRGNLTTSKWARLRNAPRTRLSVTSMVLSNEESSGGARPVDAALAMKSRAASLECSTLAIRWPAPEGTNGGD